MNACRPCLPSRAIDPDRTSKASLATDSNDSRQSAVTALPGHMQRNARAGSALCRACTAGCRRNWPPAGRVADQNGDRILNNTCFWSRMAYQRTSTGIRRRSGQSQAHSDVIVDNPSGQQHAEIVGMVPETKILQRHRRRKVYRFRATSIKPACQPEACGFSSSPQNKMIALDSIDHPHSDKFASCAQAGSAARDR